MLEFGAGYSAEIVIAVSNSNKKISYLMIARLVRYASVDSVPLPQCCIAHMSFRFFTECECRVSNLAEMRGSVV